ncbi:MAG: hypothetical protein RBU29_07400, partial [bacterium]|nr:hypothetical protein [bacterium]
SSNYQRYYTTNGMIGEAIIQADRDSRSIIVICDEETNEHVKEIIENLDRPVPQVLIKVVFLEVTYHDDFDFGVEASFDTRPGSDNGSIFETAYGLAAETQGGFYRLLEKDLSVTLHALSDVGQLEILSKPSVLTRNNQEAIITVGQSVPIIQNSRVTSDGQTINTPTYEDIGIILRVTPFITKDGLVEMMLSPEISTFTDRSVPITDTVSAPVFAVRSADTVVVTPSGKTVVIGGMMEDQQTEVTKKVPVLGDIPLLGLAFRRKTESKSKTELMIFLTPFVVETPDHLDAMSQKEKDLSTLVPTSFSPEELDRYLDNKVPEKPQPKSRIKGKPAATAEKSTERQSQGYTYPSQDSVEK